MQWVNYRHSKLLILYMQFVSAFIQFAKIRLRLAPSMMQFPITEICKRHAVLMGSQRRSFNTKILECSTFNLMIMPRIRVELEESADDFEGTATRKLHSDRSDKKKNTLICY